MVVTGGLLAAFQRHLGKIMGYAIIVETGFSLLALSLGNTTGLNIFLLLLVPRAISLAIWALTLSILREQAPGLSLKDVKGLGHVWPFATSALVLANLALAGMPLLAGFPAHQAVWEGLARSSLPVAFWVLIGSLGLFASAVRVLAALTAAPEGTPWGARENSHTTPDPGDRRAGFIPARIIPGMGFATMDKIACHLSTFGAMTQIAVS